MYVYAYLCNVCVRGGGGGGGGGGVRVFVYMHVTMDVRIYLFILFSCMYLLMYVGIFTCKAP